MAGGEKVGVVVGSANARVGFQAAIDILRGGGSAIDAAVAAVRLVEDNPEDRTVGRGGIPNVLGQVELDASIMDGRTLAAGAVGAVKNYPHPIEIARKVMELTPHVLLVGEGAELFARYHGFEPADLLTEESERAWRERLSGAAVTGGALNVDQSPRYMGVVREWVRLLHREVLGTTNVIVRDLVGNIACAVSTSGWGFKWPGRVGDSAIIGAGNYADNRFGAAACTGRGEMAIRAASAYSVVGYMRRGMTVEDALRAAMLDLRALVDPFAEMPSAMNIIAMDCHGNVCAASTSPQATYIFQRTDMDACEERRRLHVPLRDE